MLSSSSQAGNHMVQGSMQRLGLEFNPVPLLCASYFLYKTLLSCEIMVTTPKKAFRKKSKNKTSFELYLALFVLEVFL